VLRISPVASFVKLTFALGMTLPDVSVTVPLMVAVTCACITGRNISNTAMDITPLTHPSNKARLPEKHAYNKFCLVILPPDGRPVCCHILHACLHEIMCRTQFRNPLKRFTYKLKRFS
jgi:hypothetical protein